MDPRFYSEGDESAGQLPSPSVIFAKAEIQKYNQSSMDPRFYSEGDECEWARVAKVQASTPVSPSFSRRRKSRKTISKGSTPPVQGMNLNVWVRVTKI